MDQPQEQPWKKKLKEAWNENPIAVAGVAALAAGAAAKLINALGKAANDRSMIRMRKHRYKRHGW